MLKENAITDSKKNLQKNSKFNIKSIKVLYINLIDY